MGIIGNMKKTPKIIQIVPALNQGGVEQGALETARYIIKKGWQSIVISNGGRMVKQLKSDGSEHIKLPLHKRNPLHLLYNTLRLVFIFLREKPDIVHARSRGPAWSAYLACKITKTPFLTSFHGTHGVQNKFKIFYNSVMLKGERIIANSHFIKEHITTIYSEPAERITVVQRGFDKKRFNLKKANAHHIYDQYTIDEKTPVILMPGRFTRWKGQDVLLKALPLLKTKKYVVLLVGNSNKKSNYTGKLKALSEDKNITGKVIFCNTQPDLSDYYKAACITISSSNKPEAFGRIAVESQAMATPVIATAHGGSLETIKEGETGWLIPHNDPKAMANAIDNALKNPKLLAEASKNAYTWAHKQFTIDKMCRGEFNVYKEMLKNAS
jgi:glycosyltransferase involved in cell wall biosynthesis